MNKDIFVSVVGAGVVIACAKVMSTVFGNIMEKYCYTAGYDAGYTDTCDEAEDRVIDSMKADKTKEREGGNHDEA